MALEAVESHHFLSVSMAGQAALEALADEIAQCGDSALTRRAYASALVRHREWLEDEGLEWTAVTRRDLARYRSQPSGGTAPRTPTSS